MGLSDLKARMRDKVRRPYSRFTLTGAKVEDLRSDMSQLKVRSQRQAHAELSDIRRLHLESKCVVKARLPG